MYVKGFAKIAKPFNGILATGSTNPKKNRNITDQWTPEYQDAFDALKWKLVEAPTTLVQIWGQMQMHLHLNHLNTFSGVFAFVFK